ncbi:MAG: hypothetical protein R2774_16200 [Saprospiraceae bacterium]
MFLLFLVGNSLARTVENAQFQKDIQSGLLNPDVAYDSYMGFADIGLGFAGSFFPTSWIKSFLGARGVMKAIQAGEYTITKTVANNLATRPYINSPSTITNILKAGKGVPDAYFKGGMNYKVPGSFNGSQGIFELGINPQTNTIYHFLFKAVK